MSIDYNDDHGLWFALNEDGLLYNLGDHGDYEAANDTAEDLGLNVIWLFDEREAKNMASFIDVAIFDKEVTSQLESA